MKTLLKRAGCTMGVLLLTVNLCLEANAQTGVPSNYIEEGFKNNLVLQQKKVSLEKALNDLQSAKSLFLPSVDFLAGYQSANGGRSIDIPVGDMLNPVYSTLNQLTNSKQFPQIQNVSQQLLPTNFYDARVHTTMPLLNTDLIYNKKIQEQQVTLQSYEVEIYQRELVKSIKTAYFAYLGALQSIQIYEASAQLAEEGKRVNESLLNNGKGLPAYVLRSNSEIETIQAQLTNARLQADNAKAYFNFLLNRSREESIDPGFNATDSLHAISSLLITEPEFKDREELKSLKEAVRLNETVEKMNRSYAIPKLNGFLDLGSQAEGWKLNEDSRYYFAGLQLSVPIFAGNRNNIKIRQSELDVKNAKLGLTQATQQFAITASTSKNNLVATYKVYLSSLKQLEAAESYQRLIEKGYKAGTNTFIESVDARNQLTAAQLAKNLNLYKVFVAAAELERQTASYNIHK